MSGNPFSTVLEQRGHQSINQYGMLCPGDRVVVGFSGGADSVALLHFLHTYALEMGVAFSAAHLNHNLRGEESGRDERFCRDFCAKRGIALAVESLPVEELAQKRGQSVETCARELRYTWFRRLAGPQGKIAVAHTLDDSAETLLFNLARGTGLRGLCGIPPVRGQIVRPLIACTRMEVEAYCEQYGLSYVIDSTNLTDDYARNLLRHRAMPALQAVNGKALRHIAAATELLRADADYLDAVAQQALTDAETAPHSYNIRALSDLALPIRRRVLLQLLSAHGITADIAPVGQLEQVLAGAGKQQLNACWFCERRDSELRMQPVVQEPLQPVVPVQLELFADREQIFVFGDKTLAIRPVAGEFLHKSRNNLQKVLKNVLDCDKINKIVTVRGREPGDVFRPAGRGCTKSLKNLFQEQGVAARERGQVLLLAGENGKLLWVEGIGASEEAQASSDTRRAVLIEVQEVWECDRISGKC